MKQILIIKPSALGDVIQATCMLPVIRDRYPDARISWLVFDSNKGVVLDHPLIDEVFVLRRRDRMLKAIYHLTRRMRQSYFDLSIDVQCLLRSALLSFLSGCKRRVGYANGRETSTLFYTETYDIPTLSMHAVDGYLKLCEALGMPSRGEVQFPLPMKEGHRKHVDEILDRVRGGGNLITLCPTAGWKSKCWPVESFATLADMLAEQAGARIVLAGAPGEEETSGSVAARMEHPCLDLTGRLDLMEVAALLEQSDLFVGNDSGLMHMASATKTPCIALFGPTDPKRTGPYSPLARTIQADLDCMPCFRKHCDKLTCMHRITPERVAGACLDLLQTSPSRPGSVSPEARRLPGQKTS